MATMTWDQYEHAVKRDVSALTVFFPLLNDLAMVPTVEPYFILTGLLIPADILAKLGAPDHDFAFRARVIYPLEFPSKCIKVMDLDRRVDWNRLPHEHRHVYPDGTLCTHHPDEIRGIAQERKSVPILASAWRLLFQADQCIRFGSDWTLQELPHGDAAAKKLIYEGGKSTKHG